MSNTEQARLIRASEYVELRTAVRQLIGRHGASAVVLAVRDYAHERAAGLRYVVQWGTVASLLTCIFDHIVEGRTLPNLD
ncbi:hypothetical protein GIW81_00800 [Hyphomicrobium sp. xq]|uniref:Uncharacterized protein n=1 Tax=Hyphomicrobium album TaxID=2665159 RepID=A0A6I3KFC0_9HYPH|nr:hypothetical protein [Hyphomicrobium album]MTD92866.1 hypothetical protein [Hyphomicrobium album]